MRLIIALIAMLGSGAHAQDARPGSPLTDDYVRSILMLALDHIQRGFAKTTNRVPRPLRRRNKPHRSRFPRRGL